MRLGIFGGTFDPPHLGHLILAAEAHHQLSLDRLLWVLTPAPPHKPDQPITHQRIRLEMVSAAMGEDPRFELSRVDIDRPPPHYAVDTVNILQEAHPGGEMVYLMGSVSLYDLPTWHRPRAFLAACHTLGVMRRPGDRLDLSVVESRLPGVAAKVRWIDAPLLEIASSDIRQRIRQGAPYRYYLHPAVYEIIRRRGLYRGKPG